MRFPITCGRDKGSNRTLAAYRTNLEDFHRFAGAATVDEVGEHLLGGMHDVANALTPAYETQDTDEAAYVFPQLPWARMWKTERVKLPTQDGILVNSILPNN